MERPFGWCKRYRRVRKDDAYRTDTSAAMIRVTMIPVGVRRLARVAPH
jgi:hypothetical protein